MKKLQLYSVLLAQNFSDFDPLKIGGGQDISAGGGNTASSKAAHFSTPGGILSELLKYAIPAAGLILFVMIVWGGFEILSGASTPQSKDAGKQRITAALIGFVFLFVSYWIAQIVELVFGVRIVG